MKRFTLFALSAVLAILITGCTSGSKTVTQLINADPDSAWTAVKNVVTSKMSASPASIDEEKRVITVKNVFGNVQKTTNEDNIRVCKVESFDAVISMTPPKEMEALAAKQAFVTIKVSNFRPVVTSPDPKRATFDDDKGNSYGFTVSNSSDIHDEFINEVRKELEAMKAREDAQKAEE